MFRYILLPATGDETDPPVFHTALTLARAWAGHLAFLHVRLDVQQLILTVSAGDFAGGAGVGELVDKLQLDSEAQQERARQAVQAFCAAEHLPLSAGPADGVPSAEWQSSTGEEARELALRGRAADIVVLGRARTGEAVALDVLEAVLLDSGRPLLIAAPTAPTAPIGRRIVIAWKDTAEAARAVADARPLISRAEAVTIVAVEEDATTSAASCERLRQALAWHNPAVCVRHVQPGATEPVDVLLAELTSLGADLLVMGGYSHRRVHEMVFGGFTRRVLEAAHLPVMMAH